MKHTLKPVRPVGWLAAAGRERRPMPACRLSQWKKPQ